ncbi:hypothetical protein SAMN04244547_05168 [Azotobacter vinelandii]|nr:hypothetical protein SAMN04244547_05168 [Azotobacter vinelandii]
MEKEYRDKCLAEMDAMQAKIEALRAAHDLGYPLSKSKLRGWLSGRESRHF